MVHKDVRILEWEKAIFRETLDLAINFSQNISTNNSLVPCCFCQIDQENQHLQQTNSRQAKNATIQCFEPTISFEACTFTADVLE